MPPRGTMRLMPAIPESTRRSIILRLLDHAEKTWPQIAKVQARYCGSFGYTTGVLPGGEQIPLFRLRTAARLTPSDSRSTHPPATATKTPSCSPDCPSADRSLPRGPDGVRADGAREREHPGSGQAVLARVGPCRDGGHHLGQHRGDPPADQQRPGQVAALPPVRR